MQANKKRSLKGTGFASNSSKIGKGVGGYPGTTGPASSWYTLADRGRELGTEAAIGS